MKKSLIVMSLLLAATGAGARTLTPAEALARVGQSASPMKAHAAVPAASARLVHTTFTTDGNAAVYMFNNTAGGGYMLVSADDVAAPLLGYSDAPVPADGELPSQLQWWLGQYAAEIEAANASATMSAAPAALAASWESMAHDPIAPLCKTTWDQAAPYNAQCPQISSRATMTGCVATAMAQVMKYHQWPAKGKGSITYTDKTGTTRSMSFASNIDWTNMLDSYAGNYTTAQKNAVAWLMKACGFSVKMNYGTSASGATEDNVGPALVNYFNYDPGYSLCQRENFGLSDWQRMIYENLEEVGPVLYCGSSLEGGHCFVCDGYSEGGYFHFNWGWSGMYDGYYLLTALNPEGQGIGGFAGGYNLGQSIVLGIQKPTGTTTATPVQLTQYAVPTGSIYGGQLTLVGPWYNMTLNEAIMILGLKCEPVNGTSGTTRYIESSFGSLTVASYSGYNSLQFDATKIPNGTWKVSLATKDVTSGTSSQWMPVLHPINEPDYVTVTRSGQTFSIVNGEAAYLTVTNAELLTPLYSGCMAKMRFTVTNNSSLEVAQSVAPCLLSGTPSIPGVLASSSSIMAMGDGAYIDLMPGESVTKEITFTLAAASSSFKTNVNYTCALFDSETGYLFTSLGLQKVLPNPGATLSATSFALEGGTTSVNPADMHFTASVKCVTGYLASSLMVGVTPNGGGQFLTYGNSNEVLFLSAGQTTTTDFNIAFPAAEAGQTYSAFLGYVSGSTFNQLRYLNFTVDVAGVEEVSADGNNLAIDYVKAINAAVVTSSCPVTSVEVLTPAGAPVNVDVTTDGNGASVDLSAAPGGVLIVVARDASGAAATLKLVK